MTEASPFFTEAAAQFNQVVAMLSSEASQRWEHGDLERQLQDDGMELLRKLVQGHLELRYAQEAYERDVVGSDGVQRPHRRKETHRQLETLFGEVEIRRVGYSSQQPEVSALYPADGKLNLPPDKYSDELRRRVVLEASKVSFAETSHTIEMTSGSSIGKRQCEEVIVKVAQDFEGLYQQRSITGNAAPEDLLVITTDGKGIVMHPEDLREATAKAAEKAASTRQTRLSPGQKLQRKRMATVASVYHVPRYVRQAEDIIGEERDPPERSTIRDKRVWASVEQDAKTVIERDVTIVLDFIHVLEYVWKAAFCFCAVGSQTAETWVRERALRILQGKASDVAAGMRRSATLQNLSANARENVDKCADYLLNYRPYLQYDLYLEQGYPIASGVIEGACRHLINDRMDITGARWRLDRAEAVLRIRALRASGDFDDYWDFHKQQELQRDHISKFHDPERLLAA